MPGYRQVMPASVCGAAKRSKSVPAYCKNDITHKQIEIFVYVLYKKPETFLEH
jgi:hypothetical protein